MYSKKATLALAFTCISLCAADQKTIITGDPNITSRNVSYHDSDIIPIQTEVRFSTLIQLPKQENIVEVVCGDKEYWPVNWTANLAYVKPARQGGKTNLNLIASSGNVYSFILTEISGNAGAHADLKVFVEPVDSGAIVAMKDSPRFVSADAVEGYRRAAQQAQQDLRTETIALRKETEAKQAELEAAMPINIRHDYRYETPAKNPFRVTAIYHDDKMTFIEATPQEAPAIYEVKDGNPSLIQFELKNGRYIVPKVLDEGYMRVGKAELKFRRTTS